MKRSKCFVGKSAVPFVTGFVESMINLQNFYLQYAGGFLGDSISKLQVHLPFSWLQTSEPFMLHQRDPLVIH
jgi:hypothetical protein